MRKRVLLSSILLMTGLTPVYASSPGDETIPGVPSSVLKPLNETTEVAPVVPEVKTEEVSNPFREKIKGYLQREVQERKAQIMDDVAQQKAEKKERQETGIVTVKSTPKVNVEKTPVTTIESTVTKSYKIPKGSIQVAANEEGVYVVDGTQGNTYVVEISKGLFNKIVTPFQHPKILTTSKLTVQDKNGDLFVATESSKVTGIWVYDEKNPSNSVSLALLPKPTAPVTIEIDIPKEVLFNQSKVVLPPVTEIKAVDIPTASKTETTSAFEQSIVDMISGMVNDRTYPEGYGVTSYSNAQPGAVCDHPEVKGKLKQTLTGEMFNIEIISTKNFSEYPARVEEARCYGAGVVAVSVNPSNYLRSGEVGELILVKLNQKYVASLKPKKALRPAIKTEEW